jgi:hypothetical protein
MTVDRHLPRCVSVWPARQESSPHLAALEKVGGRVKRRRSGSDRTRCRDGWPDVVFAFHDDVEIGPKILGRIAKRPVLRQRIFDSTG